MKRASIVILTDLVKKELEEAFSLLCVNSLSEKNVHDTFEKIRKAQSLILQIKSQIDSVIENERDRD
jgi:hypothetical protein